MKGYILAREGIEVEFIAQGASIRRLVINGVDIVLGYDDEDSYLTRNDSYFGCAVGRVANRIRSGAFTLGGQRACQIPTNNGPNALHGGEVGWNKKVWTTSGPSTDADGNPTIEFGLTSPDGDQGFPGDVHARVVYTVRPGPEIEARLIAEVPLDSPSASPVNMAQHSYFNLSGHGSGHSILDHVVSMPTATHFTPVDDTLIPTGIQAVSGTPLDFASGPHAIGARIADLEGTATKGYDHNFVLHGLGPEAAARATGPGGMVPGRVALAARVTHPPTGRALEIWTNAPGVQLYSGNFLDGVAGKDGAVYQRNFGFCLETQTFPDSVNRPDFPSCVLQPGESMTHIWLAKFAFPKAA